MGVPTRYLLPGIMLAAVLDAAEKTLTSRFMLQTKTENPTMKGKKGGTLFLALLASMLFLSADALGERTTASLYGTVKTHPAL